MTTSVAPSVLRPMSMGEILDRAIQLVRTHLGMFAGIALLPELIGLAHALVEAYRKVYVTPKISSRLVWTALAQNGLLIISLFAGALEIAALCWAASRILLDEDASVRAAYGSLRGRAWRMVGVGTLEMLYSMWPILPLSIFSVLLIVLPSPWSLLIIVVVLLVPCAALYARYALGFPVAAIEGRKARVSIQRSVTLGAGYRWKVFGAVVLPAVMLLTVFSSAELLFNWLEAAMAHKGISLMIWLGAEQACLSAARLVAAPFSACALTLAYYDLRVRKEGLDVERMMAAAGMAVDAPVAVVQVLDPVAANQPEPQTGDAG